MRRSHSSNDTSDSAKDKSSPVSPQEERILDLIATGATNREIGGRLHLAETTLRNYVSSLLGKLEVSRRAEAAAYLASHRYPGV